MFETAVVYTGSGTISLGDGDLSVHSVDCKAGFCRCVNGRIFSVFFDAEIYIVNIVCQKIVAKRLFADPDKRNCMQKTLKSELISDLPSFKPKITKWFQSASESFPKAFATSGYAIAYRSGLKTRLKASRASGVYVILYFFIISFVQRGLGRGVFVYCIQCIQCAHIVFDNHCGVCRHTEVSRHMVRARANARSFFNIPSSFSEKSSFITGLCYYFQKALQRNRNK